MRGWNRLPVAEPDTQKVRKGDHGVYCGARFVRAELKAGVWFCSRCGKRLPEAHQRDMSIKSHLFG